VESGKLEIWYCIISADAESVDGKDLRVFPQVRWFGTVISISDSQRDSKFIKNTSKIGMTNYL